jgi:hypothetical protein
VAEFLNWNNQDPAARPEAVIDPQTGMLLKRLALPQDQPITYLPGGGDHYFYSVLTRTAHGTCQRSSGRSQIRGWYPS